MIGKKLTKEEVIELIDLYKNDTSKKDLSNRYNITIDSVSRILNRNGVDSKYYGKINKSEHQNVIDMYVNGMTQNEIAQIYNVSSDCVRHILKKSGIKRQPRFSIDDIHNIIDMYNSDMSTSEIGKIYGISDETIRVLLTKHNIPLKHRKYHIDENYFDQIDDVNKAYILGLLYADGYHNEQSHTISITLQEQDRHILEEIRCLIKCDKPLKFVCNSKYKQTYSDCYQLYFTSKHMSKNSQNMDLFKIKV